MEYFLDFPRTGNVLFVKRHENTRVELAGDRGRERTEDHGTVTYASSRSA